MGTRVKVASPVVSAEAQALLDKCIAQEAFAQTASDFNRFWNACKKAIKADNALGKWLISKLPATSKIASKITNLLNAKPRATKVAMASFESVLALIPTFNKEQKAEILKALKTK